MSREVVKGLQNCRAERGLGEQNPRKGFTLQSTFKLFPINHAM